MNEVRETRPAARDEWEFLTRGGPIVVGVDSSPTSKVALRAAARMAALTDAGIDAVCVWDYPAFYVAYEQAEGLVPKVPEWNPEDDARRTLEATVDEVFGTNRPAGLRTVLLRGDAGKRILEHAEAEGASLIVLGSRGQGGVAWLMLGSMSMKVAAAARCPVLIVHPPPDDSPAHEDVFGELRYEPVPRVPLASVLRPPRRGPL